MRVEHKMLKTEDPASAVEAKSSELQLRDFGIHLEAAIAYIASN